MTNDVSVASADVHTGRRNLGPFPPAAPSRPDAPHVTSAQVTVDAADDQGPLTRVWESIGYDEINWTYTPTGKRLLKTFQEFSGHSYYVRPHYVFCSGSGFGIPHWGSGNVYHEDDNGTPYYDFTIVDQTYDAIVDAGHHVLVELGFTPRGLLPPEADELGSRTAPPPTPHTRPAPGATHRGIWTSGRAWWRPTHATAWTVTAKTKSQPGSGSYGTSLTSTTGAALRSSSTNFTQ